MEKLKRELGPIGGAGHFFENDRAIQKGGKRDAMKEEEIRNVLKLLSLGEKRINLKFWWQNNWEVEEAGWRIRFECAWKGNEGDGSYFYLSISNNDGGLPFTASGEQIHCYNGKVRHKHELTSQKDENGGHFVKFKEGPYGTFIRFNICFLE